MAEPGVREAGLLLQRIFPDPLDPDGLGSTAGESADAVLEPFFRERHAGSRERAGVAEWLYYVLRHRRRLEVMVRGVLPAGAVPSGMQLAIAASVAGREAGERDDLATRLGVAPRSHGAVDPPPLSAAERLSLPDWLWERFAEQWGAEEAERLGESLNQPASVDLRVNTLRATREAVLAALAEARIPAVPTPYGPDGVRLLQRQPLGGLEAFKQGWFEVQDEGSQLIAPLLMPQSGETVVDLCAGGGGKTLHLAALMGNRGRIVAADTQAHRLARLGGRGKRAGVRIVRTVALRHERDPKLKSLEGRADAVLVDAPCSGLGTLRRRPELKWRLQRGEVEAYHYRQCALLEAGARLTRPGGRLLYATCSLLQRENQAVVAAFLADNKNFRLKPVRMVAGLPSQTAPFLLLLPHQTETDGFFAALLQRTT